MTTYIVCTKCNFWVKLSGLPAGGDDGKIYKSRKIGSYTAWFSICLDCRLKIEQGEPIREYGAKKAQVQRRNGAPDLDVICSASRHNSWANDLKKGGKEEVG